MALPNAYNAYANSKINTATPAQLTLMLYDGAIKFCNIALEAMKHMFIYKRQSESLKNFVPHWILSILLHRNLKMYIKC